MAPASPSSPRPPTAADPAPPVRLEVRQGTGRPTFYELSDNTFLIGTVPGCDLRLPGGGLPSVICLLTRHAGGVSLRKLAPVQPLLVNGQPVAAASVADQDRITFGSIEVLLHVPAASEDVSTANERACVPTETEDRSGAARRMDERERDLEKKAAEVTRERDKLAAVRQELADLRRQLYQRYRERRDRLAMRQLAIGKAARKVQQRKREAEALLQQAGTRPEGEAERQRLAEQKRLLDERCQEAQTKLAAKLAAAESQERKLAAEREALEKGQKQHQADLVRLDRLQATLEQRQEQLQGRAHDVDVRFEELQRTTRELEVQASALSDWEQQLKNSAEELESRKAEQASAEARVAERTAALEGQQAMLSTLRTRLERLREAVRRDEQQLADQRAKHTSAEADLQQRLVEVQRLQTELVNEKHARERERSRFEERSALLEAAVAQLRQAQDALGLEEASLRRREANLEAALATHQEQDALVEARGTQLAEERERLAADRAALQEREKALEQVEQARGALQEQLRRRSDELAARQRDLDEELRRNEEGRAQIDARRSALDSEMTQAEALLAAERAKLAGQSREVEKMHAELTQREETLRRHVERLKEAGRAVGHERKTLAEERDQWATAHRNAAEAAAQAQAEMNAARQEASDLVGQLPDIELRAQTAVERLSQARGQLREHLAEVYAYARQSRDDLEALRDHVRAEAERVRERERALDQARDEHRLAVTSFRQQLIDWQGQMADMKRLLALGETRLGRRQAEVAEQAKQIDATSARLAKQAEQLDLQERVVAERRDEVQRHLDDMRDWYRRKLRELSGLKEATIEEGGLKLGDSNTDDPHSSILAMTAEVEPGDRQLGELLHSMRLVDNDTLTALLVEARKQRRSLRQALLTSGCLTLYQLALIEAGNLDGLVLGAVRVIDRLRSTPREVVYRVFDPRRGGEAVLRHLAESEAADANRTDDFRRRFQAAAGVQHPHLAATYEVLDLAGRPAVLQEALAGLASPDWPPLTAVPGVWYRLVAQAALGLQTAHQAGLVHGHLEPSSLLLTGEGTLKVCGFGEPLWLVGIPEPEQSDVKTDLLALGHIAAGWAEFVSARKGAKAKPLPGTLQDVLQRLLAGRYASAAELLDELDQAGTDVPPNAAAWERLVRHVGEQVTHAVTRQSA
jgi:uncharacterized phage infection (PIP) family protein YhgE